MKKSILGFVAGVGIITLLAFTATSNYTTKITTSEVEQLQGLAVFCDSKPINEYEYLGTVKRNTGGFGGGQYEDVRDGLIKRAKSEYPQADGIILSLKAGGTDKADVIKFK